MLQLDAAVASGEIVVGSEAWQTYVADAIAKAPAKPSGTEKQAIKIAMTGADR